MARKSRTAVLKRQREARKAEKAAAKREKRELRGEGDDSGDAQQVATSEDLAGYGFPTRDDDSEDSRDS